MTPRMAIISTLRSSQISSDFSSLENLKGRQRHVVFNDREWAIDNTAPGERLLMGRCRSATVTRLPRVFNQTAAEKQLLPHKY